MALNLSLNKSPANFTKNEQIILNISGGTPLANYILTISGSNYQQASTLNSSGGDIIYLIPENLYLTPQVQSYTITVREVKSIIDSTILLSLPTILNNSTQNQNNQIIIRDSTIINDSTIIRDSTIINDSTMIYNPSFINNQSNINRTGTINFTVIKSNVSLRLEQQQVYNQSTTYQSAIATKFEVMNRYKITNSEDLNGIYYYSIYPSSIPNQRINQDYQINNVTFDANINSQTQIYTANGRYYTIFNVKFVPNSTVFYNTVEKNFLLEIQMESLAIDLQLSVYGTQWISSTPAILTTILMQPAPGISNTIQNLICNQSQLSFRYVNNDVADQGFDNILDQKITILEVMSFKDNNSSILEFDLNNKTIIFSPNPANPNGTYTIRVKTYFENNEYYYYFNINYLSKLPTSSLNFNLIENVNTISGNNIQLEYDRENRLQLQLNILSPYVLDQLHAKYSLVTNEIDCEIISNYVLGYNKTVVSYEIINPSNNNTVLERGLYEINRTNATNSYGTGLYTNLDYLLPIEPRLLLGNVSTLNGQKLGINISIINDCLSQPLILSYLLDVTPTKDFTILSPIDIIRLPVSCDVSCLSNNDFYINFDGTINFIFKPPTDYDSTYDADHIVTVQILKNTSNDNGNCCNNLDYIYGTIVNPANVTSTITGTNIPNSNTYQTVTFIIPKSVKTTRSFTVPVKFTQRGAYQVVVKYINKYYTTRDEINSGIVFSGLKLSSNFILYQNKSTPAPPAPWTGTEVAIAGTIVGTKDPMIIPRSPLKITVNGTITDFCGRTVTAANYLPDLNVRVGFEFTNASGNPDYIFLDRDNNLFKQFGITSTNGNTFSADYYDIDYLSSCSRRIKLSININDNCNYTNTPKICGVDRTKICDIDNIPDIFNLYDVALPTYPSDFSFSINPIAQTNPQQPQTINGCTSIVSIFEDDVTRLNTASNIQLKINISSTTPVYFNSSNRNPSGTSQILDKAEIEVFDISRDNYSLGFISIPIKDVVTFPNIGADNVGGLNEAIDYQIITESFDNIIFSNLSNSSVVQLNLTNRPGYTRINAGTYNLGFRLRISCFDNTNPPQYIPDSSLCWVLNKKDITYKFTNVNPIKLARFNQSVIPLVGETYNISNCTYYNSLSSNYGINDNLSIVSDLTGISLGTIDNPANGFVLYRNSSVLTNPRIPDIFYTIYDRCALANIGLMSAGHNQLIYNYEDINQTAQYQYEYNLSINQTNTVASIDNNIQEYGLTLGQIRNKLVYATYFNANPNNSSLLNSWINGTNAVARAPWFGTCTTNFGKYSIQYRNINNSTSSWLPVSLVDNTTTGIYLNSGSYVFQINFSGTDATNNNRQFQDSSTEIVVSIKPNDIWSFNAQFQVPNSTTYTNNYTYRYYKQLPPSIQVYNATPANILSNQVKQFTVQITAVSTNPVWSQTKTLNNRAFSANGTMNIPLSDYQSLFMVNGSIQVPASLVEITIKISNNNFNTEFNAGSLLNIENRPLETYASFVNYPSDLTTVPLYPTNADTLLQDSELLSTSSLGKFFYLYVTFNYDPIEQLDISKFNMTLQGKTSYKVLPSENLGISSNVEIVGTPSSKQYLLRISKLDQLLNLIFPASYTIATNLKYNVFDSGVTVETKSGIDMLGLTYSTIPALLKNGEIKVNLSQPNPITFTYTDTSIGTTVSGNVPINTNMLDLYDNIVNCNIISDSVINNLTIKDSTITDSTITIQPILDSTMLNQLNQYAINYNPDYVYTLTYNFGPNFTLANGEVISVIKGFVDIEIKNTQTSVIMQKSRYQVNNSICVIDIHALPIGNYTISASYTDVGESIYKDGKLPMVSFNVSRQCDTQLLVKEFNKLIPTLTNPNGNVYINVFRNPSTPAGQTPNPAIPLEGKLIIDLTPTNIKQGNILVFSGTNTTPLTTHSINGNQEIINISLGDEGHSNNFKVRFVDLIISPPQYYVEYSFDITDPNENNNYLPILPVNQPNNYIASRSIENIEINYIIVNTDDLIVNLNDQNGFSENNGSNENNGSSDINNSINEIISQLEERGIESDLLNRIKSLESLFNSLQNSLQNNNRGIDNSDLINKIKLIEDKISKLDKPVPAPTPMPVPAPTTTQVVPAKPTKKPARKPVRKPALNKNNKPQTSAVKNLVGVRVIKK